jgi:hypothetical protein
VELALRENFTAMVLRPKLNYPLAKTIPITYPHTPSGNSMVVDCHLEVKKWLRRSVTGHPDARVTGWHTSGMMTITYKSWWKKH